MVSTIAQAQPVTQIPATSNTPNAQNTSASTNVATEVTQVNGNAQVKTTGQQDQNPSETGGSIFSNIFTMTLNNLQTEILSTQTDVTLNAEAVASANNLINEELIAATNETISQNDINAMLSQGDLDNENLDKIIKFYQTADDNKNNLANLESNIKNNAAEIVQDAINTISENQLEIKTNLNNNNNANEQVIIKPNENPVLKSINDEQIVQIESNNDLDKNNETSTEISDNQNNNIVIATNQTGNNGTEDNKSEEVKVGNFERKSSLEVSYKYDPTEASQNNQQDKIQTANNELLAQYLNKELTTNNNTGQEISGNFKLTDQSETLDINTNNLNKNQSFDSQNIEGQSNNEFNNNLEFSENNDLSNFSNDNETAKITNISKDNNVENSNHNNQIKQNVLQTIQTDESQLESFSLKGFNDIDATPASEQIRFAISKNVTTGNNRIYVQLEPKELGRVEISMNVIDNVISRINITADKIETLELLQNDHKILEKNLSDSGLKVGSDNINFSLSSNNPNNPNGGSDREFLENNRAFLQSLDNEVLNDKVQVISGNIDVSTRLLDIVV